MEFLLLENKQINRIIETDQQESDEMPFISMEITSPPAFPWVSVDWSNSGARWNCLQSGP